jgi:pyrimidine-specific ribonucleoside hydrolase
MIRLIHDCDPGHDDMIALMVAAASAKAQLLGVTTVAGNQTGEKTSMNARRVLTMINRKDIPLARGADKPLLRDLETAPFIHGDSGLDGITLPEPEVEPMALSAVDFMAKVLRESKEKVTLVPTGPLTNIALLLLKEPGLFNKIERIVLMGGAARDSNITPGAEFNIYVDPEAAHAVFTSGLPITQVSLDVSNKTLLTFDDIEGITRMNGRISRFVGPLLKFFAQMNKKAFGIEGAPVHDALAMAVALDPSVATTKHVNVVVEKNGEYTRGQTVVDLYGVSGRPANVDFTVKVDVDKVKKIMVDTIVKLDGKA